MGQPTPFSMGAIAPMQVPSSQMPPEILQGVMSSAQTIGSMLDSFAQVAPDLGMEFAAIKDALQQVLAKLMMNGAPPMSPTASGQQFPGGGMDRGIAGAGAI